RRRVRSRRRRSKASTSARTTRVMRSRRVSDPSPRSGGKGMEKSAKRGFFLPRPLPLMVIMCAPGGGKWASVADHERHADGGILTGGRGAHQARRGEEGHHESHGRHGKKRRNVGWAESARPTIRDRFGGPRRLGPPYASSSLSSLLPFSRVFRVIRGDPSSTP